MIHCCLLSNFTFGKDKMPKALLKKITLPALLYKYKMLTMAERQM